MKFPSFSVVIKALTLSAALLIPSQASQATEYVWSGDDTDQPTDWFSPENWEAKGIVESTATVKSSLLRTSATLSAIVAPSGVPGPSDTATISAGAKVAINKPIAIGALKVGKGGTLQGSGTVSVSSSLVLEGARLLGDGKVTLGTNATVKFLDAGGDTDNVIAKPIENLGNLIWESGHVTLQKDFYNKGTVYLGCDAALDAVEATPGQAPTFYNEGSVVKAVSLGQSVFDADFVNSGDITVRSGRLDLGPSYIQTAGSLNLNGGDVATEGTFQIEGGVVKGIGTMDGSVVNDGGTLKPGFSPGFITILGNYTQTSNGTLQLEIGGLDAGTEYDQMNIYGSATLGGQLDLIKWNGYVPPSGYSFWLITCYNMMNDFSNITGLYLGNKLHYRVVRSSTDYIAMVRTDNDAPSLVVSQPVANASYNSITLAKGTTDDTILGSGVAKVTCRLYRFATGSTPIGYWAGGSTWTTGYTGDNEKLATGTTNWTWNLPSLANGQYYIKVTARDVAGNAIQSSNIVFTKVSSGGTTASMSAPTSGDSSLSARLVTEGIKNGKNS